ncbi:sigma-54 dependent transcriptional regulator [Akkermansiaceae bacterium]|nr:sigma-54 dependent transcriptional regulator [Akkermansiaceae bacterium]MDB4541585.1 sigma-54 dependent transcriptional regulator [Akkermansiaceae bacterium]
MHTLLIVDDEKATRDALRMALEESFDIYVAADLTQATQVLKNETVDLLLTDLRLGGDSGMDVLSAALELPQPPIALMMTAYGSVDAAVEAMRRGAWHFVTKPLNLDEVELLLKRAVRSRSLEKANKVLVVANNQLVTANETLKKKTGTQTQGLERLIGKSAPMAQVAEKIIQIAPTRATVLIEGESGTGKELVAHALHDLSGRPKDKYVVVNCAALSPQLLESELFGHEKGAFTGASGRRIGRFEQADGGTLFLDEIGEIDQATQVKLLRVLSERTIERVGSNTPVKINVRVITATNKNLQTLVQEGEFREDLYFRLNVLALNMPPLRKRREDVVLLANSFLQEFAVENNRPVKPLTDAALSRLMAYDWPGNVRELRTAIEHAVVMSNDDTLDIFHLPEFLERNSIENESLSPKNTLAPAEEFNLHVLEQRAICGALVSTSGNRTKAAGLLGISRRTLQRKLRDQTPPDQPKS